MGPETNAKLDEAAQGRRSAPAMVEGQVQDRADQPEGAGADVRRACGRRSRRCRRGWSTWPNVRSEQLRESGANAVQAMARAQGAMEATTDAVKLEGELDAGSYGGVLQARGLVGVRGAGFSYDGFYYVKQVTHKIALGQLHAAASSSRARASARPPRWCRYERVLRQVPRQGREQRRPAAAGPRPGQRPRRARRRPAELGDAVRAVRRVAGRASSRSRRSARTSGSSSRPGDPDYPIWSGCFWGTGEVPGVARRWPRRRCSRPTRSRSS